MASKSNNTFQTKIAQLITSEFQGLPSPSVRIAVQSATTSQDAIHFARLSMESRGQGPIEQLRVVHESTNETEARMIAKELLRQMLLAHPALHQPSAAANTYMSPEADIDDQVMRRIGYCGKGASGHYFVCAAL